LLAAADVAPQVDLHLGSRVQRVQLGNLALPETAFPHLTLMRQQEIETILVRALADCGIKVEWGVEFTELLQGSDGVRTALQSATVAETPEFDFVAGCDGPDSTLRRIAGIGWPGGGYSDEIVLADLELDAELPGGVAHMGVGRNGVLLVFALGERATWRMLVSRPAENDRLPFGHPGPPVGAAELQARLNSAGLDARIVRLAWSARYPLQHRVAERLGLGRLYLAGDAAHAFSPATGQGMNTGIQDALNLGWKLAFAGRATDSVGLLNSYEQERLPAARRVLVLSHLAFWLEAGSGRAPSILRGVLAPLGAPAIRVLLGRKLLVAELVRCVSQLRAGYSNSPISEEALPQRKEGPSTGQWLPNASVIADGQRAQLHALLARPGVHVLLDRDAARFNRLVLGPYVDVHRLESTSGSGVVAVRPDGYVGFRSKRLDVEQLQAWLLRLGASPS
jgi:2-polyprenyl-6-methoxyphenol hydroxylase-like FAD-dependent oxidoreductase